MGNAAWNFCAVCNIICVNDSCLKDIAMNANVIYCYLVHRMIRPRMMKLCRKDASFLENCCLLLPDCRLTTFVWAKDFYAVSACVRPSPGVTTNLQVKTTCPVVNHCVPFHVRQVSVRFAGQLTATPLITAGWNCCKYWRGLDYLVHRAKTCLLLQ